MDFLKKLRNEFIDIIEWTDDSSNTIVYRFERYNNEIKYGAKLTVREGQQAVFINEGKIADVFEPGMYTLQTQNLPILSTLKGWKHAFNSPFKAEVYFVSTRNITDQKWGTKNHITLSDNRFGMFEIRAFGNYVMRVTDAGKFIKEIVGTDSHFTNEEISEQMKSLVVSQFTDAIGEAGIPVEALAANLNELSKLVGDFVKPDFDQFGLDLTKLVIESISMPDEIKKEIFELSRLDKIDIAKLTQLKAAKSIEKAAENQSGTAGAGLGMGMGFAMANQMGNMFTQPQQTPNNTAPTPPPVPSAIAYFAVINGQQAGPFDLSTLKQMTLQNQINKDTLIWKEGMPNWTQAAQVGDVNSIFGSVPPPIPGN